jgi:hypothetical protein
MRTHAHTTVQLGQLIVAVFDEAAQYGTTPEEVSRLATTVVTRMLRSARNRLSIGSPLPIMRPAFIPGEHGLQLHR